MRYIHWRDDFSITESFSTGQASAPVPQRVRIEYFTAKGHGRFVAERNGNTFVNCELSADGNSLVVHVSLRDRPIGHGRLLRIATVITEDANFPGGLKYSSIPDKVAAVLYFGKSDGPLDIASEIVFDGVDRLSLLEDVKLSGLDIGDLLSWNGTDWVNIPRSAVAPDLSYYIRWTDLPDYVTVSDLQEILADLITSDEITSLSQRITATEQRIAALEQVQFLELDGNGNVKLKDKYGGLWAAGWIAAGGVGSQSGGGGGGSSFLNDLLDVTAPNPDPNDLLRWNGSAWVNVPQTSIVPTISVKVPSSGNALTGVTASAGILTFTTGTFVNSVTVNQNVSSGTEIGSISVNNGSAVKLYAPSLTRKAVTDLIADRTTILGLYADRAASDADGNSFASTYATIDALNELNSITDITTQQDCTVDFTWKNGNITKIDLNHDHTYYVAGTLAQHISSKTALLGVTGISNNSAWTPDNSQIIWEAGNNAWHFKGNLYADGWIAAGGIGDGAGGGGGTNSLYGLVEVLPTTNPSANHLFYFNGTKWMNTPVKTINGNSIVGSGDITISSGGGSTVSISDLLTSGTRVATITIDGTPYDIKAPSGGSGGSTVSWGDQSGNTIPLTVDGTTKSLLISETDPTVPPWAKESSKPSYKFSEISSKPTTISGYGITDADITNEIVTLGSKTIKPVTIDTNQTITGAKTFTTQVVTIGSTSGISVNASSYIDIGPVRLKYENNAIHVTKASSSDTNEYGMYADGFVAAGGIGSSSSYEVASNKVTSLSSASTDTQYPSAKCVYDIVGNIESLLGALL